MNDTPRNGGYIFLDPQEIKSVEPVGQQVTITGTNQDGELVTETIEVQGTTPVESVTTWRTIGADPVDHPSPPTSAQHKRH